MRRWRSERSHAGRARPQGDAHRSRGEASRWSICTALPTCTASPAISSPSTSASAPRPGHRAGPSRLRAERRARRRLRHRRRRSSTISKSSTRSASTSFDLVGHCVGGWIAAELAVRHPERVRRLGLIGACGLFVPGAPIGDVFMHSQPERGVQLTTLAAAAVRPRKRAGGIALLRQRPRRHRGGDAALSDAALRLLRRVQAALFLQPRTARAALPRRHAGRGDLGRDAIAWCRAPMARPMSRACRAPRT